MFRGESIERAFEQGRIQIGLEIYGNEEAGRTLVPIYSEEELRQILPPEAFEQLLQIKQQLQSEVESNPE